MLMLTIDITELQPFKYFCKPKRLQIQIDIDLKAFFVYNESVSTNTGFIIEVKILQCS